MAQNSDDDYMPPEDEIRREILSSIKRKSKQPKKAKIIEDDPVKEVLKKFNENTGVSISLDFENSQDLTPSNEEIDSLFSEYQKIFLMDPMFERIATPLRNGIPNKKLSEQKRILAYLYKLVAKSGGFERVTGKHEWGVIANKVGYP